MKHAALLLIACAAFCGSAGAEEEGTKIDYKLTGSYYHASNGNDAEDINLRATVGDSNYWIGHYREKDGFAQSRLGMDTRFDLHELLRASISPEIGTLGYKSLNLGAEVGGETYAILGIGRTNLRPCFNLNFDPCDAITVGVGTRAIKNMDINLFAVIDDRLDTQQRVTHLNWRYRIAKGQRLTIGLVYKSGFTDENVYIHGRGLMLGYDYNDFFFRISRDEYAGFSNVHLTRFAGGMRF
ncbi:hypothetical protein [Noviherbaspirillum galbum]|uniref:Outer membrane protein beta-barrel domain-containing protein n=1 Tax=Noviherbaspirillum galbum TaxID=2709383 RepID=A0A6B3SZS1_9BURK|nr:hypothetical protein [Noviherbaspirillum galbum]NEX64489.1 hypothetical protein [Noviherbaspirillum galbum]